MTQQKETSTNTMQRLMQENQRLTLENQRLAMENQRLHERIESLSKREWQHQQAKGVTPDIMSRSISELHLSRRNMNLLTTRGYRNLGDIISAGRHALIEIPYMGIKCISEIDHYLESIGISWDTDVDTVYDQDDKIEDDTILK